MTENPFEYQYKPNETLQIPANALLNILHFCTQVIESQPTHAVPYAYASDVKTKKDAEGNIMAVNTEWTPYPTLETFLQTIENPVAIATKLTIQSEQIFYALSRIHQENINKGIAKKIGTLTKEQADDTITSTLSKANKK